jgi:chorismate-pyruvate lyase
MGSINIANIIHIERNLCSIKWHSHIHVTCHTLRYWLRYTHSLTLALARHNFKIQVLFNQKIQGIWHRHVVLYAFNRPFIYAITCTKHPYVFGMHMLGKKSIGTLLFQRHIQKSCFKFCNATRFMSNNNNCKQYAQKYTNKYGRKRCFTKIYGQTKYNLELYEFFL